MGVEGIGASVVRKEDRRFITGKGHYTDDHARPGQTVAHFLRSPHAHAKLKKIDTTAAAAMPGVLAVFTGDDFALDRQVHTLKEQVVPDGEMVCALGYYSAEKDGLIPGFTKGGEGLTIIRGGEEAARKALKGNVWQYIAAGIGILLVSHFFLFMFLFLREPSLRAEKAEASESALLQAAQNGDAAAVQAQLANGTDANARDSESNTPLMLTRDPEVARRLIAAGADVNARNRSGSTPLIEAAKSGAAEVARLLVQAGADLEARETESNKTALEWAVQSEQEEVARVLREAGAKTP